MAADDGRDVYRPRLGRAIAVVVVVVCAFALGALVIDAGASAVVEYGAWLGLIALAAWAMFWRPEVAVSDGGVRLVNVTRTIDLPWPAITAIEMKWVLELETAYGRYSAWAAPARSRGASRRSALIPRGTYRTSDASAAVWRVERGTNPAAATAETIAARWEQLRRAGHLDEPRLEHERAPVHWHVTTIVVGAALLVVGIVTAIV